MAETPVPAFLALGGNIGDVRATFEQAIALLCDGDAVRLMARSSDYRTPPWGVTEQPPFINAVIAVATTLQARDLLARALQVERALGLARDGLRAFVISGNLGLADTTARYDRPAAEIERHVADFIRQVSAA